jgi:hypothetical protein
VLAGHAGFLLCPQCNTFFGGNRGLRTHQQMKHGQHYCNALQAVHAAQRQLIVRPAPLKHLMAGCTREGAPNPGTSGSGSSQEAADMPTVRGTTQVYALRVFLIMCSSLPAGFLTLFAK